MPIPAQSLATVSSGGGTARDTVLTGYTQHPELPAGSLGHLWPLRDWADFHSADTWGTDASLANVICLAASSTFSARKLRYILI